MPSIIILILTIHGAMRSASRSQIASIPWRHGSLEFFASETVRFAISMRSCLGPSGTPVRRFHRLPVWFHTFGPETAVAHQYEPYTGPETVALAAEQEEAPTDYWKTYHHLCLYHSKLKKIRVQNRCKFSANFISATCTNNNAHVCLICALIFIDAHGIL